MSKTLKICKKYFVTAVILISMVCMVVSVGPINANAATSVNVPVLCYHVVTNNPSGTYQFSLSEFKNQLAYLKKNGYTTLSMNQFIQIMNNKAAAPSKPILLTFDDCTSDFASNVVPALSQYGMKATQFVVSSWVNTSGHLTSAQLKSFSGKGYDIQCHTVSHISLKGQSYSKQYSEIQNNKTAINSYTGITPSVLAYPYGPYDQNTITAQQNSGIKMGFTVNGGLCNSSTNKYALPRAVIVNGDSLTTFARKITKGY
ncbi:MAG: polysaccharide deacetylase family protein [Bacillota bacterium]|nr:polysaccharide deacetylase family protein [Bacillota bacterium]